MMRTALLLLLATAAPASAQDLDLSGGGAAVRIETSPADSVRLPAEPWAPDAVIPETEGAIRRTVYHLKNSPRTTLQLLAPAREALSGDGYEVVFSCADAACGGFDFRFQLDLLPEPDMHVDLGNYRYLLMQKDDGAPHTVSLVSSRASNTGFLHVTEVYDAVLPEPSAENTPDQPEPEVARTTDGSLIVTLRKDGHAILGDLLFPTGSAELTEGSYASLADLSEWLAANPSARIVLVGHTDAVGSLEANVSLSQRRAAAVVNRLVQNFGTDRDQLQSAGAGYLSPVASNLSDEGRAANRRVEVVLLSLD